MSEGIMKFCEICQTKVTEDIIFHLLDKDSKLKLLDLLPEIDLHLTQNSVICDQCFTQVTDTEQEFKQLQIKDVPSSSNFKELNKVLVNNNTVCVKEEPGVEKIKEEFNVGLIKDEISELEVTKVDFLVYIDKKNSTETYYCCACGCCTDTKQKLIEHINKQHRKKDLMVKPTIQKIYQCNKCNYKCASRYHLKKHEFSHTNEKSYKCTQCAYRCNSTTDLENHMNKHTFQCDKCDYKCRYNSSLKRHILSKHNSEKPFQCDKCDYKSSLRSCLKLHILSRHTVEKPYQCDKCDYQSARRDNLKVHQLSHTGEYLFQCDMCDYKCARRDSFKLHKLYYHTDQKPHQCDKCDFKCVFKSSLKRHTLSQHTLKSARKNSLRVYNLTHSNEKSQLASRQIEGV